MLDTPQQVAQNTLKELPLRLHHQAYTVKDQEANRHFIEDILGIPLAATWCERVCRPEVGREVDPVGNAGGASRGMAAQKVAAHSVPDERYKVMHTA
jgi:catechol 2,3-dioxygenase-like lactoylglutathione lyase family enzyme